MSQIDWLALEGKRVRVTLTTGVSIEGEILGYFYDLREVDSAQEARAQGQKPKVCQLRMLGSKRELSLNIQEIQALQVL